MINLDTNIKDYGKVAAVGNISGERYYWLIKNGVVSMMPASFIEEFYNEQIKQTQTQAPRP